MLKTKHTPRSGKGAALDTRGRRDGYSGAGRRYHPPFIAPEVLDGQTNGGFLRPRGLAGALGADEPTLRVSDADTVHDVLARYVGRGVTVKLDSGSERAARSRQSATTSSTSELAGKEFYDAVVDLDEIAAVIVRVRER
ncbi:MAG: hypothetical protein R2991_03410 [Thermoanaerobaculia bacterium]